MTTAQVYDAHIEIVDAANKMVQVIESLSKKFVEALKPVFKIVGVFKPTPALVGWRRHQAVWLLAHPGVRRYRSRRPPDYAAP